MLSGGLESEIQTTGVSRKAKQRGRQPPALLCSAVQREGLQMPSQCAGKEEGIVTFGTEMWELDFNSLHCQQQCSIPKTRELGKAEKNKINEHARWRGRAVLCLCKTLFTMWTQTGLRQGLGL